MKSSRGHVSTSPTSVTGLRRSTGPPWIDTRDPRAMVPMVAHPDDFVVVVAGGDGRHSTWMPAWNVCQGAREVVEEA